MDQKLKIVLAAALLTCVLAIVVAPSLDLPETALSMRHTHVAFLGAAFISVPLIARRPLLIFPPFAEHNAASYPPGLCGRMLC